MKFEIIIDDEEISYEVKRQVFKELTPYNLKELIKEKANSVMQEETEKMIKGKVDDLIKEGVVKYLEKYNIRDVIERLRPLRVKKV